MSTKNPQTPAGIEPATFRFVAQHLNHCAAAVPTANLTKIIDDGLMATHYNCGCVIVFAFLKTAKRAVETCRWLQHNKLTFTSSSTFVGLFKNSERLGIYFSKP